MKLGNPQNLKNAEVGRVNGRPTRPKNAAGRAADLAPVIAELQASEVTSLRHIAAGLNDQGIRTVRGSGWSAMRVQRVVKQA